MSSGKRGRSYSRRLPCLAAPWLIAAAPPVGHGALLLDAAVPVVTVQVAGRPLRLRVDPAEHGFVLLDRAAAARLPLRWTDETETDVGRVRVPGRLAHAVLSVDGTERPVTIASYVRDCCADADGAIGPDTLPYAIVRWRRGDAPPPTESRTLALATDLRTGVHAAAGPALPDLSLVFTLYRSDSAATAAGAAILAAAWDGRWDGPPTTGAAPFGLTRPLRPMAFARPGTLAGFPIARLPVRIADFGGHTRLPEDAAGPDDIVVSRPLPVQDAWPAVILGPDLLRRCAEIVWTAAPRTLTLRCAFAGG